MRITKTNINYSRDKTDAKVRLICAIILIVICFPLLCGATSPPGSLTVLLNDSEGQPINDLNVKINKIATISGTDYFPEEGFSDSGINIADIVNDPSAENAQKTYAYVNSCGYIGAIEKSSEGKAVFSSLEKGIWLISCEEDQKYTFAPFFVFLPNTLKGETEMNIVSAPKTEENVPNNKRIYVVKMWRDDQNAANKRPNEIYVTLKKDGEPIANTTLSDMNGWSYFFEKLPDVGTYTVEEQPVEGYTVNYSGDAENGFVITNVFSGAKLPQTGDTFNALLWGALALFSAAAVCGVIYLKKQRRC